MKEALVKRFYGKYQLGCAKIGCRNEYLGSELTNKKGIGMWIYIYKGTGYCFNHLPKKAQTVVQSRKLF